MKTILIFLLAIATLNSAQAQSRWRHDRGSRDRDRSESSSESERSAPQFQFADAPHTAKRQVQANVYDLTKFFSGELKPGTNTPWAIVTGTFVRVQPFSRGWVIKGAVNNVSTNFVLRNPPQLEFDAFKKLQTQYNALLTQFHDMTGVNFSDVAEHPEMLEVAAAFSTNAMPEPPPGRNPPPQMDQSGRGDWHRSSGRSDRSDRPDRPEEDRGDHHSQSGRSSWLANPAARELAQRIQKFDTKGLNLNAEFSIQCYAIKTTEKLENLPVYDRGRVVR